MKALFLSQYLKNVRTVGSITPSSRYLANRMLESIDFDHAQLIVEYGPGTGAFTSLLAKRKRPSTKLLVIETNEVFYELLSNEFAGVKNVEIILGSAEHTSQFLTERKLPRPDVVVSGLPFAALPAETSERILDSTAQILEQEGRFITFQYTLVKRKLFERYFNAVRVSRELRNIPPAYILTCSQHR